MFDFSKCRFDDAEILQVSLAGADLQVKYRDWQEREHVLIFQFVAGYQWLSPEGKSLSHGVVEQDDPFLAMACEVAEEDPTDGFGVYSFVSAWNDAKILRIVAKAVHIA